MRIESKSGGARRLLACAVVALCVAALLAPATEGARPAAVSTVRGRVDRENNSGKYPAPYVRVTIRGADSPREKPLQTYTEKDGMYYFRELQPGDYVLEIWNDEGKAVAGYRISVLDKPFTDIKPVVIP